MKLDLRSSPHTPFSTQGERVSAESRQSGVSQKANLIENPFPKLGGEKKWRTAPQY